MHRQQQVGIIASLSYATCHSQQGALEQIGTAALHAAARICPVILCWHRLLACFKLRSSSVHKPGNAKALNHGANAWLSDRCYLYTACSSIGEVIQACRQLPTCRRMLPASRSCALYWPGVMMSAALAAHMALRAGNGQDDTRVTMCRRCQYCVFPVNICLWGIGCALFQVHRLRPRLKATHQGTQKHPCLVWAMQCQQACNTPHTYTYREHAASHAAVHYTVRAYGCTLYSVLCPGLNIVLYCTVHTCERRNQT